MYGSAINGEQFTAMLAGGLANLRASAEEINDLNVFPIPDGDTGDNMVSTLSGGLAHAKLCRGGVGEVADCAAKGMLLGARGNSGVILSQMFSGIASDLAGKASADVGDISAAFDSGAEHAYSALSEPVEGTMLTVMRLAAEYARNNCGKNSTVERYFSLYEEEAERALENTPELLPVLKEAGTVDSGGAGLVSIVRGFLSVLRGEFGGEEAGEPAGQASSAGPDISLFTEDSELTFGYCTEFLLRLMRKKTDLGEFSVERFRKDIDALGSSVVALRQGSMVKVHVHTAEPWQVLRLAQRYGEFLTVKIENMNIQHSEAVLKGGSRSPVFKRRGARKRYGVVAAAAGEGMCAAFGELGADVVIDCDKYGSPSVELFSEAVEAANADCVFVLPDDKNAFGAAEEAARLTSSSEVRVLPTRCYGEGYVALSALDCESGDTDGIISCMNAEVKNSACGAVARAVRGASLGGVDVSPDDYIAVSDKKILCASASKTEAAVRLAGALGAATHDFIIVFCGSGASAAEREECRRSMCASFPSAEYYELDGGQKTYDFMVIVQ